MSMKAIADTITAVESIAPAAYNASVNGATIDLANAIENKIDFVAGTRTDGTHTPKLQDSPDGTTWSDVTAANMEISTNSGAFANITTGSVQSVSYIGAQRYLRAVSTVAGATTGAIYSAVAQIKYRKQF